MILRNRFITYLINILVIFSTTTCTKLSDPIVGSSNKVVITTGTLGAVDSYSAQVSGQIQCSASNLQGKERGICWSTSQNAVFISNLSQNTFKLTSGSGVGSFNLNLLNLTPGRTYFYRSYIILSGGSDALYGEIKSFTTLAAATTAGISNISSNSAISGGTISSPGGAFILQRGVCFSTTPNPTTANSRTTDGSGTGNFISTISNLNPSTTYYVRAYATTSSGTAYGNQLSFTTLCNFSGNAPLIVSPVNAQSFCCNTSITLSWNVVDCSTGYDVQISKSSTFSGTIFSINNCTANGSPATSGVSQASTTNNTFCFFGGATTLYNGTWYWRVRAKNNNSLGTWSAARTYNYTR